MPITIEPKITLDGILQIAVAIILFVISIAISRRKDTTIRFAISAILILASGLFSTYLVSLVAQKITMAWPDNSEQSRLDKYSNILASISMVIGYGLAVVTQLFFRRNPK